MTSQVDCCTQLKELKDGIYRIIIDEKGYGSTSDVVERLAKMIGVNLNDI